MRQVVTVGLLGLGVVGSAVARALLDKSDMVSARVGCPVRLKRVLVRQEGKDRPVDSSLLTTYRSTEASMARAVKAMAELSAVEEVSNLIRIEE